jgi:putative ATP-dependent endonuclease of the OLD family
LRIVRIQIENFRCIREAQIRPAIHNVFLGPNNSGKTAVLEALNLALSPEITYRTRAVDENDFFRRQYLPAASPPVGAGAVGANQSVAGEKPGGDESPMAEKAADAETDPAKYPPIRIEVILADLDEADEDLFRDHLVPWLGAKGCVIEKSNEGENPFSVAQSAIRVVFEGWFDPSEDDFFHKTFFLSAKGLSRDECPRFDRDHKRHIGFLIYRDFRALTRPVTLDPGALFGQLMSSQEAKPRRFEDVLVSTSDALGALHDDKDFASLLSSYQAELERFLPLTEGPTGKLIFNLTDRTRRDLKSAAQLYAWDALAMPMQKMGAGTRSLAILAILTLLMRRRGRGILALEEPESFLFPHAQRRVIDEGLALASQTFVTTHSPFVLERIPIEGVGRLHRDSTGRIGWSPLQSETVKKCNFYSRFLRKAHCEALVGRAVVVVEGESDRWWLNGVGRALNRTVVLGRRQEALELQGIAVVAADGAGDVLRLAEFFHEAGLRVVAFFDRLEDTQLLANLEKAAFPCLLHRHKGLEELLARELPISVARTFLKTAPHAKDLPLPGEMVDEMGDDAVRVNTKERLTSNKGSAFMHEWLLSTVKLSDLPASLVVAVDLISQHVSCDVPLGNSGVVAGS